ncbi:MAG: exodeoxyribonuclease V subunit gamma, partial [Actinomycetes bacterium]
MQVAGDVRPLADGLAIVLARPLADPFAREWVGVPTDGMQRWLKLRLAHHLGASGPGSGDGVTANVDFRYPGTLRQVVLAAARHEADVPDVEAADPWRPEHLVWAVLEALRTDPDPARFGPLAVLPSGATWYGRSLRAAQLFDHYAVRRPDLLRHWAAGRALDAVGTPLEPADRWQFELWQAAHARLGTPSPPELVAGVLDGVRAGTVEIALPERLAVFGLTTLPYGAPFLDLLDAIAAQRDVHVFLLDPSATATGRVQATVLAATPDLPVKSVKDLIALAKNKPGAIAYGSSGVGSTTHIAGEMLASMAGIQLNHVPYKSASAAYPDVFSGRVALIFDTALSMLQHIKAERVRPLAVTTPARASILPNLPTISEAGVPGYAITLWIAIYAPAGTPA